jgi:hypothetical protein
LTQNQLCVYHLPMKEKHQLWGPFLKTNFGTLLKDELWHPSCSASLLQWRRCCFCSISSVYAVVAGECSYASNFAIKSWTDQKQRIRNLVVFCSYCCCYCRQENLVEMTTPAGKNVRTMVLWASTSLVEIDIYSGNSLFRILSGRSRRKIPAAATTSKKGSRHANYPIPTRGGSDNT